MKEECDIRGPCDGMRMRLIEDGRWEPPTKWVPGRLLLGTEHRTDCPYCAWSLPPVLLELWKWDELVPAAPPYVPPSHDPRTWDDNE